MVMGAAFSTLYPALSLHVVNQVPANRRGVALGTFTAFFDVGMAIGARSSASRRRSGATRPPSGSARAPALAAAGVVLRAQQEARLLPLAGR